MSRRRTNLATGSASERHGRVDERHEEHERDRHEREAHPRPLGRGADARLDSFAAAQRTARVRGTIYLVAAGPEYHLA